MAAQSPDAAPGFYFDQQSGLKRWWDGERFTNRFAEDEEGEESVAQAPERPQGNVPPGFYFDPVVGRNRYFDGEEWTEFEPMQPAASGQDTTVTGVITAGYVFAVLMPIVGFVIGITQINRNRHGVWVVIASVVAFVAWLVILVHLGEGGSSASPGYYR